MTIAEKLCEWYSRAHVRVHDRPTGTNGPDDMGAHAGCTCPAEIDTHAGCTCPAEIDTHVIGDARRLAARVHARYKHAGPPDACQSPHDVLCKAVW